MSATLPQLRETPQGVTVKRQSEVPAKAQDSNLSASVTADSFYPPYYTSSSDDDRMSDLDRLDAILAPVMPVVLDESPPPTNSDTAAAATPGPSPTPRGGETDGSVRSAESLSIPR
jgi:hypothetical protein